MNPAGAILEVAVPAPLAGSFDYLPPAGAPMLAPGQRLLVPFGRSNRVGLLLGLKDRSDIPDHQLRRAHRVLDPEPLLPPDVLGLVVWAARYYQHPVGEVFAAALPKALRSGGSTAQGELRYGLTEAGRGLAPASLARAPVQQALLSALAGSAGGLGPTELGAVHSGWRRALRELLSRGYVGASTLAIAPETRADLPDTPPVLTEAQATAVAAIGAARGYQGFLLDGVTGSGKTEVYLRCIAGALERDQQCLVLVPEIGLTPQLLDRFRRRFPVPVAELHSGLTDAERLRAWTLARAGTARIILGTRSAVFAPLARPGLLIVDEEHDASLKQQEGFRYSARDLAVWRARELAVPLVLGSATPSLESVANAKAGRYTRLVLPARTGRAGPPGVGLVDLRAHPARDGLSQPLRVAIGRHLVAGGQVLLYLNRRGFAPTLLCPGCGWLATCQRCDARLVCHLGDGPGERQPRRLSCHHCGAEQAPPTHCPDCQGELRPVGQGTQRLEQALARAFPGEEVVRIDRDTTRRRGEIGRRLDRVRSAGARLLLGTQMLTKGHDFPGVTLVGIVDADQGLFGTDFRSAERLAQSFIQVAGRAGRAERPGEVLIQTLFPDHPLLRVLITEGYGGFAELALAERRQAGWPPYSHLALLRAEAARRPVVFAFLEAALGLSAPLADPGGGSVRLLGPAPAPMERRSGRFRGQLLVQAGARSALHRFLPAWRAGLAALPAGRRVRWSLDVDPMELF